MIEEHPVEQPIHSIDVDAPDGLRFAVGKGGVTRIEACFKSGMHSHIPYVRVWAGDTCLAEFCQHHIVGVYFSKSSQTGDQS